MTDLEVIKSATYSVLENGTADATGTSLLTSMFAISEIVTYINNRQYKFQMQTGLIQTRTAVGGTPSVQRYALPSDWIQTRRAAWKDASNVIRSLVRSDIWQLDNGNSTWGSAVGLPQSFNESQVANLTIEVAPPPQDVGSIQLLYIGLSTLVDGTGINLTVTDEFAPYITWGVLADLLGSDGEAFDPERAEYCETRYSEGVELAKLMLGVA